MRFLHRSKLGVVTLALGVMATTAIVTAPAASAATTITVNLATPTGAVKHGASGFLYGLGDEGIPTDTMLAGLSSLGVAAQKAPDGLQHPNGDALKVAPEWRRNGGRDIQIYMQDIYQQWPYENLGLDDYLAKVDTIAQKVVADPNRASFVYVPLNEPDWIWYGGDIVRIEQDWKTIVQRVRATDPTARVAGPNFSYYDAAKYRAFMAFAQANGVLPDVVTWHELDDNTYTSWYDHYNDYRQIETDLGIATRPISINEYGRPSDLAVPGNLVQLITRFETSKVDGSLAYWSSAGALNDLVVENNKPTGAWWLYHWYGLMTGNTVAVTLPSLTQPTQALASYDAAKKQARILLGGNLDPSANFDATINVTGLAATPFSASAHVTVWGIDSGGLNPSPSPYVVKESDITASGGALSLALPNLKGSSAYYAVITPNTDTTLATPSRYEAEYAKTSGTATVTYGANTGYSGTYFVEGYGASNDASTSFFVNAPTNGYYNVSLRYSAGPFSGAPANRSLQLKLNQQLTKTLSLASTPNWNTWKTLTTKLYLPAGINELDFNAYTNDDSDAVNLDYIDVAATTGTSTSIEAESSGNTLSGTAVVSTNTSASGGAYVGYIGNGAVNTLQINGVTAATAGDYTVVVTYANGELGSGAQNYNSNVVDRFASLSVNGGTPSQVAFRNTLGWSNFRTTSARVTLAAGSNTLKFSNAVAYVADIDKVVIAPTVN